MDAMSTYVVGTDGSETAAIATRRAAELARATGARLHIVSAYTGRGTTTISSGSETMLLSSLGSAEQIAEQEAAAFRAEGLDAVATIGEGRPADVLLDTARDVDAELIIVGNRRMQGLSRVLGAVANEVVHRAPCDVLLVKTT
jgi:nucleotide-binding universal stress UspA family protein